MDGIILSTIATKDLVNELISREGVSTITAEPYLDMMVSVNGPAIALVVTD